MNLDARLKKVETIAEKRLRADFCLCVLDQELSAIFLRFLADRGVAHESENPFVVTKPCAICLREVSCDLTMINEEERAAWHRLANWTCDRWDEKRRTGRIPEVPEEIARLEKWLRRRCRAADERAFGKHAYAAVMFAYRRAKELFPFAADCIDEGMREYDEAGTGDPNEPAPPAREGTAPEPDESEWA